MSKGFKNFRVVSDAFARPADTTQYAAGDSVAPASKTITAASNASPIVITSTTHGYATGDRVTIASVGGNTAANGDWTITRIDANSYSLDGSTGNSAYTSGGSSVRLLRLSGLLDANHTRGKIVRTKLMCNSATVTSGTFRVYFFTTQIAQIADNAAWTLLYASRAALVGHTAVLTLITAGSGSDAAIAQDVTSEIPFVLTDYLFAVIVADAAYTPTSGETFYLEVTIEEV